MNSSCVCVYETLIKCLRELSTLHTGGESDGQGMDSASHHCYTLRLSCIQRHTSDSSDPTFFAVCVCDM